MYIQGVDCVSTTSSGAGAPTASTFTYGDVYLENERQYSAATTSRWPTPQLPVPRVQRAARPNATANAGGRACRFRPTTSVLKCCHAFNLLDARGVISATERMAYILRVRTHREGVLRLAIMEHVVGQAPAGAADGDAAADAAATAAEEGKEARWTTQPPLRWHSRSAPRRSPRSTCTAATEQLWPASWCRRPWTPRGIPHGDGARRTPRPDAGSSPSCDDVAPTQTEATEEVVPRALRQAIAFDARRQPHEGGRRLRARQGRAGVDALDAPRRGRRRDTCSPWSARARARRCGAAARRCSSRRDRAAISWPKS